MTSHWLEDLLTSLVPSVTLKCIFHKGVQTKCHKSVNPPSLTFSHSCAKSFMKAAQGNKIKKEWKKSCLLGFELCTFHDKGKLTSQLPKNPPEDNFFRYCRLQGSSTYNTSCSEFLKVGIFLSFLKSKSQKLLNAATNWEVFFY